MSLSELQQQFAQDAALLVQQVKALGYATSYGETWRDPRQAQRDADHGLGVACSLHTERLAIDLDLFVNGVYQVDDSSGCYSALGAWWKALGPEHYWGGDFAKVDLDHFSISPDGGKTR